MSDYIPFYFTPHSPMLLNIKTGYNGLKKTPMCDIAILVTSLPRIAEEGLQFVFTDRHAYVAGAEFFGDLRDLDRIDWPLLRARDFSRDPDDPGKCERYQAEALIHRVVPVSAFAGIACYSDTEQKLVEKELAHCSLPTKVAVKPEWYF